MVKTAMLNDAGKPSQSLPVGFQPGGGVVVGDVWMVRDNVRWRVRGYELETGRVFCQLEDGGTTAWLPGPGACRCLYRRDGFRLDQWSGLWVHDGCGKPTQPVLDAHR